MRKLHLILLSLVAAIPGGVLCYLLGSVLTIPRHDLWNKPLLGIAVVSTGLMVLVLGVVWPLLYAVAFYEDPFKGKKREKDEPAEGEAESVATDEEEGDETPKTPRSDSFEEEDIDAFEREGLTADTEEADEVDDFEEAAEGSEFDLDEESIDTAETADFDLGDDEFADLDMDEEVEEEEEAPKKKAKKKKK